MVSSDDTPLLCCRELSCGYQGKAVLRGIELEVRPRSVLAILGGSGSGKSTLLKTIGGLLPPVAGRVELFGEPLYEISESDRRRLLARTGTLFQHDALFGSMTVLENLLVPFAELTDVRRDLAEAVAYAKLELVQLQGLGPRYPAQISGGQRKRVALARATMLDPEVLFCDEPTSGLDPIVAAEIDQSLRQLADVLGIGLVVITHDVDSVRSIADFVLLLEGGKVRARGSISELLRDPDPFVRRFLHRTGSEAT